jgi:uncharacterized protein
MLRNSFIHIPGISKEKEVMLWQSNITNWQEFLDNDTFPKLRSWVEESLEAHNTNNHNFFLSHLPSREHWRTYNEFKHCFLDIETTGLSKHRDEVTVIGLYDGRESKIFINGKNLDEFPKEIAKYQTVITFNGKCFDVPFLKAKFPEVDFNKFHIDLRYVMKDLGFAGGLKKIEKDVGIQRDDDLQEVDGYEAVRLWHRYKKGDDAALRLLVKYNIADIENLKTLMDFSFEKLSKRMIQ